MNSFHMSFGEMTIMLRDVWPNSLHSNDGQLVIANSNNA